MADNIGKLEQIDLAVEAQKAYLDYAMSVIVSRALPDIRDGLKPVHRRILFAMHEMNLNPTGKHAKSAKVVGEVMGKYHPHGDMAIYDTIVRLAQDFAMRYPLVHGQGNFGSIDGDPAAAMRYCLTEDTLVVTNHGLLPIGKISDGKEKISISILSKDKQINHASKWFDSGIHPTIKIETKQGFTLQGSYNHPLLTWTTNKQTGEPMLEWKLLSTIKNGDIVVLDRTPDLLWPTRTPLTQFIPQNVPSRTQIKILPKTMTKQLAFILGGLIAEGTVKDHKLEFCNSDKAWMAQFKKCWEKTFPDTRLHEFERKPSSYGKLPYYTFEIHSGYVIAFLKSLGLTPEKASTKVIPDIIFKSSKPVVATFLKAYFEGDGSISSAPKMVELSCCSKSELLLKQMQILLMRFGIVATKRFDRHRLMHKLYIRGLKNYQIFRDEIGFVSQRKNDKLDFILSTLQKDQSILDYVPFLKDYVRQNLDETLSRADHRFLFRHNFDRQSSLHKHEPQIVSSVISSLQPNVQKLLKNILSNNYVFDPIINVEEGGTKQVYSIKVDSTCHSFVANGFINHNTEVKLASIAVEMLRDIEKETVDYIPNFDATLNEPVYLPSLLPNLLLAGSEGIAVGMATKIPPHNLTEVLDAIIFLIGKTKAEKVDGAIASLSADVTVDELIEYVKGPDFPTGGAIYDINEIKNVYRTGRGKIVIRGIAEIEDISQGKTAIIIRELPYQVNKSMLVAKIADLAKEKRLEGISDLRDESDRHGIRVVIELKRDATPKKVLNNLFKLTSLQTTFPANCVALVDGVPKTVNLKIILEEYLKHRFSVVTRRSEFELREAQARLHILDGLLIAVNNIDAVIKLIRESESADAARERLMERFKLSEIQSTAILDMQLRRLAALEREKLEEEWKIVKEMIDYLNSILGDTTKMLAVIKGEVEKLKEKFGDPRRTRVYKSKVDEFSEEDLIQNEPTVITITQTGYIKRQSMTSFRTQNRGGKGVSGMTTKEDDAIEHILYSQTHDFVLFYTNTGKVYQTRVFEIPESSRVAKGQAIVNLIDIPSGETIKSVLTYNPKEKAANKYVLMATVKGEVKKTSIDEFKNIRKSGILAIKIQAGDELSWVNFTTGDNDVLLVTKNGKIICFNESQIRATGRSSMGVRGIKLVDDDVVVAADVIEKNSGKNLLVVTANGIGKKTKVSEFRNQNRGGQGIKVANITDKTGKVVFSNVLKETAKEVIITSLKGVIVKLDLSSIPLLSRNAQGVILMRFKTAGDRVSTATAIDSE